MNKVFKFGALAACDGVREQMRLGRMYYNRLVEAENERRKAAWGGDHPPPPPHEDCKCGECKAHWKAIRAAVRAAPPLDLKPFRSESGLYWGTYLKIEEAFKAAWTKTSSLHKVRFRSWRQGDLIAVQIQKGKNSAFQYRVCKVDDPRTGRRAGQRHTLQIRIGSDHRKPVWSEPIPFTRHRPIEGEVTWAIVTRGYVADREVWSVQFVCRGAFEHSGNATRGVVAIDVGWRLMPNGQTRIAFARSDQGDEFELLMPERWGGISKHADGIQSVRDTRVVELKARDPRFSAVRSPAGVVRVVHRMEAPEQELIDWVKRDRHLWQYEAGTRRRSVARRRNDLRVWLRMLRNKFATVIIKDSSHKEMKEKKTLHRPARRRGHHAAPGEVIEEIIRYFGRDDGTELVSGVHTTNTCVACAHVNNHGPELIVVCEQCGATDDRDRVSTRNMLDDYAYGASKKPTARKTTARFAKRHTK